MNVGEIFIKLGFKADTFTLKDFSKTIGDLPMKAVTAAASIAGVSLEIGSLVKGAMEAASGFQSFTATTGLASQEMQRWGLVAKQVGMDVGGVESSFRGVTGAIQRMNSGLASGETAQAFAFFHLNPQKQDGNQMMEDIRKQIGSRKFNKADMGRMKESLLPALGINVDTIMRFGLMPKGEFARREASVGVQSNADIEAAAKLTSAFALLAETIQHSVTPLMTQLAEAINLLLPHLKSWLNTEVTSIQTILKATPQDKKDVNTYVAGVANKTVASLLSFHTLSELGKASVLGLHHATLGALEFGGHDARPRTVHQDNDLNLIQHNYFSGDPEHGLHVVTKAAREKIQAAQFFNTAGS